MHVSVFDLSTVGYLGMRHISEDLRPWDCLSNGRPQTIDEMDSFEDTLATRIAVLQGCEAAVFATSTFQLFWGLFDLLADEEVVIYIEEGTYPVAKWGVERASYHGVPVSYFTHQSLESLNFRLSQNLAENKRPVVVVDGISSTKFTPTPISDYLKAIEPFGGLLVIDDTQALGLFGHSPHSQAPFGSGGGGSLQWHRLESPNVLLVSSLAKGFGVPIAVFSGSRQMVEWFRKKSQTLEHCSPPCIPLLHAIEHALNINESEGDKLRYHLSANIMEFQTLLENSGFSEVGSHFPIQIIPSPKIYNPEVFNSRLQERGLRVLLQESNEGFTHVVLCITAEHSLDEIGFAARILVETFEEFN
jgi:8-amino-7-oxononanoate synthase